jgi:hypothetical protein
MYSRVRSFRKTTSLLFRAPPLTGRRYRPCGRRLRPFRQTCRHRRAAACRHRACRPRLSRHPFRRHRRRPPCRVHPRHPRRHPRLCRHRRHRTDRPQPAPAKYRLGRRHRRMCRLRTASPKISASVPAIASPKRSTSFSAIATSLRDNVAKNDPSFLGRPLSAGDAGKAVTWPCLHECDQTRGDRSAAP